MKFSFPEYLLKRYSASFTILSGSSSGSYDTSTGKWMEGESTESTATGCIVPYAKNVVYQSGGSILTTDRQVYTKEMIPPKTKIRYRNEVYKILEETAYDEYSMFHTYMARRVDAFD